MRRGKNQEGKRVIDLSAYRDLDSYSLLCCGEVNCKFTDVRWVGCFTFETKSNMIIDLNFKYNDYGNIAVINPDNPDMDLAFQKEIKDKTNAVILITFAT